MHHDVPVEYFTGAVKKVLSLDIIIDYYLYILLGWGEEEEGGGGLYTVSVWFKLSQLFSEPVWCSLS